MYGLIGKMLCVPSQRDALVAILLKGVEGMPGCINYVIAHDPSDPNAIWITEVWDSQASHSASLHLPQVRHAISLGKPLIAGFGERFVTTPVGGAPGDTSSTESLRTVLKNQYHAALAMLGQTISKCPDDLWYSKEQVNAFWQVAYHTLYFAHLYLQPNEAAFRPWEHHQGQVQHEDAIAGSVDPTSPLPLLPEPYTRAQVLEYWRNCDAMVDDAVNAFDPLSPESGFSWYKVSKLEHQLINIRHIQLGAAQLASRLRSTLNIGVEWVGSGYGKRA